MTTVVNKCNHYFVNVGPELAAGVPDQGDDKCDTLIKRNLSSLFLSDTNGQEVTDTIQKCKSKLSTDRHDISMMIVKRVTSNIVKLITYICNLSF